MLVQNNLPIGIYADSTNIKSLYKLLTYNLDFHIFGTNLDYINSCIKYILNYKKNIIVHYNINELSEDILTWYNTVGVIVSIDDISNISLYDTINLLPKHKRLIINLQQDFHIGALNNIIYYYYEYNHYHCGVNIEVTNMKNIHNVISQLNEYFDKRTTGYDDLYETAIRKYKIVSLNDYVIPYTSLYFSISNDCLFFENTKFSVSNLDLNTLYKSLYTVKDDCKECIVCTHCSKYKENCYNSKAFYEVIIGLLLHKAERIE